MKHFMCEIYIDGVKGSLVTCRMSVISAVWKDKQLYFFQNILFMLCHLSEQLMYKFVISQNH